MFNQDTKKLPIEHPPQEALRIYLRRLLLFFGVVAFNIIFFGLLLIIVNDLVQGMTLVIGLVLIAILSYISLQLRETQQEAMKTKQEVMEIHQELRLAFEKIAKLTDLSVEFNQAQTEND